MKCMKSSRDMILARFRLHSSVFSYPSLTKNGKYYNDTYNFYKIVLTKVYLVTVMLLIIFSYIKLSKPKNYYIGKNYIKSTNTSKCSLV